MISPRFSGQAGPPPPGQVILELQGMTMLYPGTVALNHVDLEVRTGECHGIIGKNGAGKTTLMKIISGLVAPTSGLMFIRGRSIKSLSRQRSRREGISIVTQEPQIIPEFTVAENLFYPDYPLRRGRRLDWTAMFDRAEDTVARAGFHLNVRAKGSDLTISEQQLLLVLKAFFVDDSPMVILDEVTAALTMKDQEFLFDIVDRQRVQGKAILFISHRLGEILRVCDRITVLRDGRKITTRPAAALSETDLSGLIVGRDKATELDLAPSGTSPADLQAEAILTVTGLILGGCYRDMSFSLRRGEILGLAGLRGSGRTELLKTIAGALTPDAGTIRLDGRPARMTSPAQALKAGVVYLPEDRDLEGLIEILSVKVNLTLSALKNLTKGGLILKKNEDRIAGELVRSLNILTASPEQEVRSLSGGNRQKVVIGKLMSARPRVYLLDEPTKGMDIGAKKAVLSLIRDRLTREAGVILTSPGLEDLIEVCDRILVLFEGRVVREFQRTDFDPGSIYLAMQGVEGGPGADANISFVGGD
ncbi:MAG: sugar ABC transporter ATP-binding protein [Thermodesulfobacteriota bacterium]